MKTPGHIEKLISGGENQTLDFKFEISNAQKIAKTLVAFANTDGGTLLIGVKDNGVIAGVRTDEEVYMIESASKIFSRPKINFEVKPWNIRGKQVLEITIPQSDIKPHFAKDADNKWKAYIRVADQNFLANNVQVRAWKEKEIRRVKIKYSRKEEFLLDYLKDFESITFEKFIELAEIKPKEAENILVDFIILDIIEISFTEKEVLYSFKE
ncbi:MAG: ATP-binding protein [Bacteroidales bacterium]|nr:ATP-binding protein [Bacteroidales bacterium]